MTAQKGLGSPWEAEKAMFWMLQKLTVIQSKRNSRWLDGFGSDEVARVLPPRSNP